MSPLLKIISLQWEGRDAYNFSISNCVVSLHAGRNLSIISPLLLISLASECIFLFTVSHMFTMIPISWLYAGHSIVKTSFSCKYFRISLETWQGVVLCRIMNSHCMVIKVPAYLRPKIIF